MRHEENQQKWLAYLKECNGTFEFRCRRYAAVYEKLVELGLSNDDLVVDVGAGNCEFGRYLYALQGFRGRYQAVDGCIDGTELEAWEPKCDAEFFVAIEVIEHMGNPMFLARKMKYAARKGVVLTTPNPEVVDVAAMDRTHLSEVTEEDLHTSGFRTETHCLFHRAADSILAWRQS